jgi:peptidyl-prolyl cis-trans isomerase C
VAQVVIRLEAVRWRRFAKLKVKQIVAMKALSLLVLFCSTLVWAQPAPAGNADKSDTVVGILDDGTKITRGELDALTPLLSETYRPVAEQNPEKFLTLFGLFKKAAALADQQKLADQEPFKQGVEFATMEAKARLFVLNAQNSMTVSQEEVEAYYNEHKEPFRKIKVSGLKVAFGPPEATANSSSVNASRVVRPVLTEDEAKAKAEKLVAQIRGGADFSKLVQLESDDVTSRAKGGDLGVWGMTDNVPDALRAAVLGLKEGEISDPIKQTGGYYIVHADAITYTPLADIKDAIFSQVKQEKAAKFLDELYKSVKVTIPAKEPVPQQAPSDPKK